MTENIVQFPNSEKPVEFLIGPIEFFQVVYEGRAIPGLTGKKNADDSYSLTVDKRFTADFPDHATAYQAVHLVANALAVGAGYTHAGAETKDAPFAPQFTFIGGEP